MKIILENAERADFLYIDELYNATGCGVWTQELTLMMLAGMKFTEMGWTDLYDHREKLLEGLKAFFLKAEETIGGD